MDAGAETSASYLQNFVISLLQSPESQRKAQKEIDRGKSYPDGYSAFAIRVCVVLIRNHLIRSSASDLSSLSACRTSLLEISHIKTIISPGTQLS